MPTNFQVMRLLNKYSCTYKKKKAKETVCSRNVILMKILQQFTFMNKEGINKKLSVKTKIFIKKKRNITDIKNA